MTEVEFHTGVADPVGFACRLLQKAVRQGVRVQVTAPLDVLARLDLSLWTADERDFVPHVRVPSGAAAPGEPGVTAAVAARTPIWLAAVVQTQNAPRVLVNVGAELPSNTQALERVIEIVSAEPGEAARGRERWRVYKSLGMALKHHPATTARDG